eukprot:CAMPEP_0194526158 /NCGR_PEP_ID=MMETSP0253-20130528/61897_1 /TAXON_ID=2966 /ORGANISM="Noctiluca scintillans" /LENGTH=75 /DNA_ID=CAMNT_0039370959 /DNA_START=41 /DNA_END=268 /DNA_ORIENTATION=-
MSPSWGGPKSATRGARVTRSPIVLLITVQASWLPSGSSSGAVQRYLVEGSLKHRRSSGRGGLPPLPWMPLLPNDN